MTEEDNNLEKEIFKLSVFILSSAKILNNEPPTYGPSRLLTLFGKLVNLSYYFKESESEFFWSGIREIIKTRKENNNKDIINDTLSMFLNEARKRSRASEFNN